MSDLEAAAHAADRVYMRSEGGSELETLADAVRSVIVVLQRFEEIVPGLRERFDELADQLRAVDQRLDGLDQP